LCQDNGNHSQNKNFGVDAMHFALFA